MRTTAWRPGRACRRLFSQTTDDEVRRLLATRVDPPGANQQTSRGREALDIVRKHALRLNGDPSQYDALLEGARAARAKRLVGAGEVAETFPSGLQEDQPSAPTR